MSRPLVAQSSNAQLSGLVTDSTGAVIPNAEVHATNTATNVAYKATSNGAAFDVPSTVLAILQENGNMVTLTDLPKHMLNKLVSVTPQVRMAALAAVSAQNMPALAQSLGITFDGMTLYKV